MQSSCISTSIEETQKWGDEFSKELNNKSLVAFYGTFGCGKTTLIRAIVAALTENTICTAASPTFVYLNEYRTKHQMIYHFDLYRLKAVHEFIECGFEEYFNHGICLIEWPERIKEILPKHCIQIQLDHIGEDARKITIMRKG